MSKDLNMSYLLDFYGNVLTEKQRDMMQQYYNMDLSLSEIADNFGITRQGVRDSIKRGENILTELEEQVGFAEKYRYAVAACAESTCNKAFRERSHSLGRPVIMVLGRYAVILEPFVRKLAEQICYKRAREHSCRNGYAVIKYIIHNC